MCGIFGLVVNERSLAEASTFEAALKLLFKLSEPRGREAAGLALAGAENIEIFKQAAMPSLMLARPAFQRWLPDYLHRVGLNAEGRFRNPVAAIGHCRLVTNGSQVTQGNNQPVMTPDIVGIHNGIITNVDSLWAAHTDMARELDVDTEVLFKRIAAHLNDGKEHAEAVDHTFAEIQGAASTAFFRKDLDALTLATNTGSLYWAADPHQGIFVFASERYILEQFAKRDPIKGTVHLPVHHLKPGEALLVPFRTAEPEPFYLTGSAEKAYSATPPRPHLHIREPASVILDKSIRERELHRCTSCLLPHTYPFIEFNSDGVCNYCENYTPQSFMGHDSLQAALEPHRKSNGEPDCILALSGGRDSSYGLHYVKTELGMNPIAYTYDWGLVTDLARRNQARLCGKLGVEHIVRAEDIPKKRRFIRRNIEAWLKRPELGMVPIFMAGDKMFFHYARKLRDETGIKPIIFCSGNELERCEFKVGFCGVKDLEVTEVLFRYPMMSKLKLALYYGSEYFRNPAYFNESFWDSLFSFYSTFVAKEDFHHLYHYIPWNEQTIDDTLKQEYDWELASESDNTWRIGDGYTSFINLIYFTVAGFSEYDTFRSNQIRSGLISREAGLKLVEADNTPRMDALREFAHVIGFNLDEALMRINAIPKLY